MPGDMPEGGTNEQPAVWPCIPRCISAAALKGSHGGGVMPAEMREPYAYSPVNGRSATTERSLPRRKRKGGSARAGSAHVGRNTGRLGVGRQ